MIYARKVLAVVLVAGACLLVSACGDAGTQSESTVEQSVSTVEVAEVTPESLAGAVVETWSDSMQELVALLEERPAVSSVMSQVQELKEDTIQILVALGHQRETLSAADKAKMDSLEWSAAQDMSEESWYATYSELWTYYAADDLEFANTLADFNVLTQYSAFELLRQQLPEEAARLGVE